MKRGLEYLACGLYRNEGSVKEDKGNVMKESQSTQSWDRVVEIATLLQDNPKGKKRKKLLCELLALAEGQRSFSATQNASTEASEKSDFSGEEQEELDSSLIFLVGDPEDFDSESIREEVVWIDDLFQKDTLSSDDPFVGIEEDAAAENIKANRHEPKTKTKSKTKQGLVFDAEFRSIIHPVEGVTQVMPDVATDVSDFFSVPEASKDDIIWRAPLSHASEVREIEVKEAAEDAFVSKDKVSSKQEDSSVKGKIRDVDIRLGKEFGLSAALIADMEIEPAVLEALLAEIDREHTQKNEPAVSRLEATEKSDVTEEIPTKAGGEKPSDTKDEGKNTPQNKGEDKAKKKASGKKKTYSKQNLAGFKQIYTSRDGALCMYQDSAGHIISIDASRLV